MENIKIRNLYLPILHKTKLFENTRQQGQSSFNEAQGKNNVIDMLKLIQRKRAQLQRNTENQESDDSQDYQNDTPVQSKVEIDQKNKAKSFQASKLLGFQEKFKTFNDQHSESQNNISSNFKARHFRVRTHNNQNSSKSTQNAAKVLKKVRVDIVQAPKPQIKSLNPKQLSKQIAKLLPNIPAKIKQRNQTTLKQIIQFLQEQNPFFMKLDRVVITCLLKVCKIVRKVKRQIIYVKQSIQEKFYVILGGRVKISNSEIQLRKVCVPGETVLEETWINFSQNKQLAETTEKARSVGVSYLLEIPLQKFKKVKQQLTKFGFRTQYNQLQALIKRNYIHKNAIRKQKSKF